MGSYYSGDHIAEDYIHTDITILQQYHNRSTALVSNRFLWVGVKDILLCPNQKKRWEDNIKEWTGMDFASSTRAAENRSRWNGIVANSSVVPRRPSKVMG